MPEQNARRVRHIVRDNHLDPRPRKSLLWGDIDTHIAASHVAEESGNLGLMSLHLQEVTRLLIETLPAGPLPNPHRRPERAATMRHRPSGGTLRALYGQAP